MLTLTIPILQNIIMATYPIKFFLLNKNELTYEVLIRGEEPASTVLELRKQINKLTPLIPTCDIYESGLDPLTDIDGVITSLSELSSRMKSLDDKYDPNLLQRTIALSNHLYHRIKRIDTSDPSINDKIKGIFKTVTSYINKLSSLNKSTQPVCEPVGEIAQSSAVFENFSSVSMNCDRSHINDLQKIKYNGKSCVHAFVQRVEEYRTARNINSSKLLSYATEIFTGDALHWYRSIKGSITTWDDLIALLVEDFSQFDYDYKLLSEIRNRTQGETENITIYFAKMAELFSRLTVTISEQEKLSILMHNIRPCYASVLASNTTSINTIENLKMICKNFEKIQSLTSQFKEPPRVSSDTLAPDLAFSKFSEQSSSRPTFHNKFNYNYNNPKHIKNQTYSNKNYNRNTTHNNYTTKQSNNNISAIDTSKSNVNTGKFYCPRCRTPAHSLRQCTADRYPICFKCGTKNVIYPNCTKCNPKN